MKSYSIQFEKFQRHVRIRIPQESLRENLRTAPCMACE